MGRSCVCSVSFTPYFNEAGAFAPEISVSDQQASRLGMVHFNEAGAFAPEISDALASDMRSRGQLQ